MIPSINSIYQLSRTGKILYPQELFQYYDFKFNNTQYHRLTYNGRFLVENMIKLLNSIPDK